MAHKMTKSQFEAAHGSFSRPYVVHGKTVKMDGRCELTTEGIAALASRQAEPLKFKDPKVVIEVAKHIKAKEGTTTFAPDKAFEYIMTEEFAPEPVGEPANPAHGTNRINNGQLTPVGSVS